jgi:hypothetical protein
MGFFADIQAIKGVTRIKSGGTAKLSISQITCLITNMPDARKNLSNSEFEAVYALYKELRKCNTKMEMDTDGYVDTAVKIIKKFDEIAPYEKYSGGNELEFSFMMDDIREFPDESNIFSVQKRKEIVFDEEDKKYMDYIMEQSSGQVNQDDARDIMRVIYYSHEYGKAEALKEFDIVINRIIENNGIDALYKVSFLSGLLCPNGVVTKEESDELSNKYSIAVMETEVPHYGEIESLYDSLNSGVITQEEFEVKKKEILGK